MTAVQRLVHKADFEAMLSAPVRQRSAHFALHHLPGGPLPPRRRPGAAQNQELSTETAPMVADIVDNCCGTHWLGLVVPKRHARRAVTRSMIKRQMRQLFAAHAPGLPPGRWVLRLKAPCGAPRFVSAASPPLHDLLRAELTRLLAPG